MDSKVITYFGVEAWDNLLKSSPPWFKTPQSFQHLIHLKNSDYMQIVREETENIKIDYYRKNGLTDQSFCGFSTVGGSFTLLGDGNHRFLDCLHIISEGSRNFENDIKRVSFDVIYLVNFPDVLRPDSIWKSNWKM